MTRRRLVRSVVRLDLSRMLARERLVAAGLGGGERPLYAERIAYHAEVERSLTNAKVLGSDVGSATPNARGARGGNFKLPATLLLPRWDIWAPVLRLAPGNRPSSGAADAEDSQSPASFGASQRWRCHIVKTIVRWVEGTLSKFDQRLGRLIHRLECMIPAVSLEYEVTPDGRLVALAPLEPRDRPSVRRRCSSTWPPLS